MAIETAVDLMYSKAVTDSRTRWEYLYQPPRTCCNFYYRLRGITRLELRALVEITNTVSFRAYLEKSPKKMARIKKKMVQVRPSPSLE